MKQVSLFPIAPPVFGGNLPPGRRKSARPLAKKRPTHLILKAKREIFSERKTVLDVVFGQAVKQSIRIYDLAVAKDHLHLVIVIPGRREYRAFIRSVTGLLARLFGKGLWTALPFTRVALWGTAYRELQRYMEQNREEALGRRPYKPRQDWYQRFRPEKRDPKGESYVK
jgi:hypothetical protein